MTILLSLMFIAAAAVQGADITGDPAAIDDLGSQYSIEKCKACHEDVHAEWSHSMHSKSITDSRVIRTWRTFIMKGLDASPEAERSDLRQVCLSCHAPQTQDAPDGLIEDIAALVITAADAKDKVKRNAARERLSTLSVNCLICHSMKGAPDGKPRERTIYGPEGAGKEAHQRAMGYDTVKSSFLPTPEFCAQCHHGCPQGMSSTICPTTYSSYREDYLAGGGTKRCQDCHMKGKDRAGHSFPGIYDTDFVKSGIGLSVRALATTYVYHLENRLVPAVFLKVNVQNTAGHLIPHG